MFALLFVLSTGGVVTSDTTCGPPTCPENQYSYHADNGDFECVNEYRCIHELNGTISEHLAQCNPPASCPDGKFVLRHNGTRCLNSKQDCTAIDGIIDWNARECMIPEPASQGQTCPQGMFLLRDDNRCLQSVNLCNEINGMVNWDTNECMISERTCSKYITFDGNAFTCMRNEDKCQASNGVVYKWKIYGMKICQPCQPDHVSHNNQCVPYSLKVIGGSPRGKTVFKTPQEADDNAMHPVRCCTIQEAFLDFGQCASRPVPDGRSISNINHYSPSQKWPKNDQNRPQSLLPRVENRVSVPDDGCSGLMTASQAVEFCAYNKRRVCTVDELMDDTCGRTGCGYDGLNVWALEFAN